MKCSKCKIEMDPKFVFCPYCGKKISADKPTQNANGMGTAIKRGSTWTIRVTVGWKKAEDGHLVQQYKSKGGFKTRRSALQYAPILLQTKEKTAETLDKIYNRWEAQYSSRIGDSTMAGYRAAYKHFKPLHLTKVDKITANMLQDCIDNCPNGKRTKQVMKVIAGLLMKYAMDDDQIMKNPAANLYTGDDPTTTRDPITEKELAVIKEHFGDEEYAPYVYALCYLGFRPTEFLSLKKDQYHVDGEIKYLTAGIKTEAGIDRAVTIPPAIIDIIENRMTVPGTDLLFPRKDKNRKNEYTGTLSQMSESYFREFVFKPMMERLGINGKLPYGARHTYANKIKNVTGADKDKASLMGHADYETTKKHYQSTSLEDREAITNQLV